MDKQLPSKSFEFLGETFTFQSGATIAAGDVYVIASSDADPVIVALADPVPTTISPVPFGAKAKSTFESPPAAATFGSPPVAAFVTFT